MKNLYSPRRKESADDFFKKEESIQINRSEVGSAQRRSERFVRMQSAQAGQGQNRRQDDNQRRRPFVGRDQRAMTEGKLAKPKGSLLKVVDWIVKLSIYLTAFLVPLFFLLNVPSAFGLSKQMILSVIIGIGFLAWVGQMAWCNEIRFRNNFVLIPVVVWLGICALSSIFSVYREQSFWGYFGGEGEAFITLLFLVAGFMLVFNNIKTKREAFLLILVSLISGLLVSVFSLIAIYKGSGSFITITVGSVYVLSFYVGALFLLAQGIFLRKSSRIMKIFSFLLSILFAYVLTVINLKLTFLILIVCLMILLGVVIARGKLEDNRGKIVPMVFLLLFALLTLLKAPIVKVNLAAEPIMEQKAAFSVSLHSLKQKPLLGFGSANYSHAYKLNRPVGANNNYWTLDYATGSSYFSTLIATTGILGALAFLFLLGTGVVYFFREVTRVIATKYENRYDDGYAFLGAGLTWFFLTLVLFFYPANITLLMLWWFSFALFLTLSSFNSRQSAKEFISNSNTPKSSLVLSFVFVMAIIGLVAAIYLQSQKFLAATKFNRALTMKVDDKSKLEELANGIQQAIQIDPSRDIYHRNMANVLFAMANQRVMEKGKDLSSDDSAFVSNMIIGAKQAVDRARLLDPENSENQVATAQVYEGVLLTMDKADEKAIEFYQNAINYDPLNPVLYQQLANIYVTMANIDMANSKAQISPDGKPEVTEEANKNFALAKEQLEKALAIKNDFASARFLLSEIYERRGETEKAIEEEQKSKKIFFNDPLIPFRLGLIYYRDKQMDNAEKEFEVALRLDKNYSNARYFLGLVLDNRNDRQGALEQFKKIEELNPNNDEVKKIISNLESGKKALAGLGKAENSQNSEPVEPAQPLEQEVEDSKVEANGNRQSPAPAGPATQPRVEPNVERQAIPREALPDEKELNNEDMSDSEDEEDEESNE